ncbi:MULTISPECIES: alpha/beta hydrolase [Mycobacteroides]|jgi:alpha-beta hydrolase superfamily lysophospholipase|uniref:alpha/beta hydrolase n=1 Tax=Mycobacteroides TaxID=670516 RepID=UPI0004A9E3D4|nr:MULTISPECIES: alpha/beta hydrolase [Mycobacteroides]KRQ24751.1 alpha/beta hydrolase [Mycobacteroides sp. H072]KRQ37641.1 alpha/beta hydrolase [Mycobacteroides sp. H002]KRQ47202.1 alpha/beta hydrolase [Mycobacteroides sp. H054]KRQ69156.1 alpha/beta hydrolase [Mycobacteroides sp. H001]MBF9319746.1 alpha/beta hydrolase [Mycobacteroides chelonae]
MPVTWESDVLDGYLRKTIELGIDPDGEGVITATLVRPEIQPDTGRAVLMVHGYTDYFFHTELAEHFSARGYRFFALDLRKCGRSRRAHQTPHYISDLSLYDAELNAAVNIITGHSAGAPLLVYGHSAGGLIVSLWLNRLRVSTGLGDVSGLILNSPWLDLQGRPLLRSGGTTAAVKAISRFRAKQAIPLPHEGAYGASLHKDFHGEFDYNLEWKPVGGFPVRFGWISAIRRGHAELHRGLDVGVPNLILRSDRSLPGDVSAAAALHGDAVLDVQQIARWAGCIGNHQRVIPIPDAKHDVFLSVAEPRTRAYRELNSWLDWYEAGS